MTIIYQIFGYILQFCYWVCGNNFIVALILFTVIAKLLMLPLSFNQQKNSVKMAKMKPEMDALQKKYGANREKYSEELQKLYDKYNYKMSSGCLPMLIQFPIIMGLYGVIYYPLSYILNYTGDQIKTLASTVISSFSGKEAEIIQSVINAEKYSAGATGRGAEIYIANAERLMDFKLFGFIDLAGTPDLSQFNWLWLIPLMAGLSAMLSSYISMKMSGQEVKGMTKGMVFGMPLISVVIAFSLPATIGFYWTISSILQVATTYIVKKLYNPEREDRRAAAKREKERAEKLDRLRRLHNDDDDDAPIEIPAKDYNIHAPVIKDDPRDREADITEKDIPQEPKEELTKSQKKKQNREKLSKSRNNQ